MNYITKYVTKNGKRIFKKITCDAYKISVAWALFKLTKLEVLWVKSRNVQYKQVYRVILMCIKFVNYTTSLSYT